MILIHLITDQSVLFVTLINILVSLPIVQAVLIYFSNQSFSQLEITIITSILQVESVRVVLLEVL